VLSTKSRKSPSPNEKPKKKTNRLALLKNKKMMQANESNVSIEASKTESQSPIAEGNGNKVKN
jgi:hypothetical protein